MVAAVAIGLVVTVVVRSAALASLVVALELAPADTLEYSSMVIITFSYLIPIFIDVDTLHLIYVYDFVFIIPELVGSQSNFQ